jgi:hypothetical protein
MTLADAQEFTAPDNPAFQLVSPTFLGPALWRYIARGVKTFTILVPSIKAVSLFNIILIARLSWLCIDMSRKFTFGYVVPIFFFFWINISFFVIFYINFFIS